MSAQSEAQIISNVNSAVVAKAIQEPSFRAQLLANPKATVEKALNTQLPSGLTLKVIEADQTNYTIVLPYQPKTSANGELSDADLESVAGGSKSGADSFFGGVASGLLSGQADGGDGSGEGLGGSIVGATINLGLRQ